MKQTREMHVCKNKNTSNIYHTKKKKNTSNQHGTFSIKRYVQEVSNRIIPPKGNLMRTATKSPVHASPAYMQEEHKNTQNWALKTEVTNTLWVNVVDGESDNLSYKREAQCFLQLVYCISNVVKFRRGASKYTKLSSQKMWQIQYESKSLDGEYEARTAFQMWWNLLIPVRRSLSL